LNKRLNDKTHKNSNGFKKMKINYNITKPGIFILLMVVGFLKVYAQQPVSTSFPNEEVLEKSLKNGILDVWYPLFIDKVDGGYFSNATFDWKLTDHQTKMLVSQSRQLWTSSQAAMFYNDTTYTGYARHGFKFLIQKMWDKEYGGFFNIRAKDGNHTDENYGDNKMAYGNAFAIYGLSSYYQLTKDPEALDYAKKAFLWLEKHSHDRKYGGYVDPMTREGIWQSKAKKSQEQGVMGNQNNVTLKDYNSSIHLMEAFTELYKVWPDPLVKARLQEMFNLVRDTFTNEKGYLNLNFTEDWKLVSNRNLSEQEIERRSGVDYISFGHDVETAFLLLETSDALGIKNDVKTLRIAKKMADHSLANGFDQVTGSFYNEGYYYPGRDTVTILSKNAEWWVQAEGLNTMLMMYKIFPAEKKYYDAYVKVWGYIYDYLIDKKNGEWYVNGMNYNPLVVNAPKASIWKANYHNGRALMNCLRMLRGESELIDHFSKIKL